MPPSLRVRLGYRIRQLRKERSWRQIDLAAHAELSQTHVCEVELGKRELGIDALKRIAAAFDMKASELLRRAGE
jgi:transcriptional regulator with XRE-family HTH domain